MLRTDRPAAVGAGQLAAEARGVGRLEAGGEHVDGLLRLFNGSGERLASLGHPVACENLNTLRCSKLFRVQLEMPGKFVVQPDQSRRGDGSGPKPREDSKAASCVDWRMTEGALTAGRNG